MNLQIKLEEILNKITKEEYVKMADYVRQSYIKAGGYEVDDQFIIDFFEQNYAAGIWYEALSHGVSEENYNLLMDLEDGDWEHGDEIGCLFGEYVVANVLKEDK